MEIISNERCVAMARRRLIPVAQFDTDSRQSAFCGESAGTLQSAPLVAANLQGWRSIRCPEPLAPSRLGLASRDR